MKHFLSSFVVIFFIVSSSYATKDIPDIDTLTYKKTWLGLLHYDPNGTESSILNKNFFLSKKGKTDPKAELIETIRAYKKNDMSIICKYPARYYWLDSWYHWKDYRQKELQCENYNKWDLIANTKHISIVFVSGFLGNPASAFGHSFIKLNKTEGKHVDLLANTISYGAKLPEKYTMLSYIYNGVVGGYKASYSDEYYYMNDMKVRYIPSAQQSVYAFYKGLSTKEKSKVITYIETNGKNKEDISHMNINSQIKVLDFLLDFQTYKMSSLEKGSEIYQKEKNIKHKLLLQRISLPKSHYQKPSVEQKLPITDYNPPNKIALSLFYNKEEKGLKLRYTPFAIDATGFNIYDGDILKVLETSISRANPYIGGFVNLEKLKVDIQYGFENTVSKSIKDQKIEIIFSSI